MAITTTLEQWTRVTENAVQEPVAAAVEAPLIEAIERVRTADLRRSSVELPRLEATSTPAFVEDAESLRLIASLVRELAPRHIIEFGCGVTTELLALLGFEQGRMAVTTYEHDPWAAEELLNAASPYAINYRWFTFCICPLVARPHGGAIIPVYDDRMTVPTVPYPADLAIISGPPDVLGGRAGIIYQALDRARAGTIILLLDVRPGEEEMLEGWVTGLEEELLFLPFGLLGRHLAFVARRPLAAPIALEHPRAQQFAPNKAEAGERAAPGTF